jgi:hypothetical protein
MIIINYILGVLIFCASFLIPFGFIFDGYGYSKFGRVADVLLVCLILKPLTIWQLGKNNFDSFGACCPYSVQAPEQKII